MRSLAGVGALAGIGGLVLFVDPASVAQAMQRFDVRALVPVLLLVLGFHLLQGLRWHLLLRHVGLGVRHSETQLINLAGQAATAVVPLGDLTRALLASRIAGTRFGTAAATVTVQELSFMLLVVAAAAPGLGRLPGGPVWMLGLLAAIAAVVVVLTVPRAFAVVRRAIAAIPLLRRCTGDVEVLQQDATRLLKRPDVLAGAVLDLARVLATTVAMLLVLRGLHIGSLGWTEAALVVSVSFVGGALSFLPGGIGANEASVVGVLVMLGINPAAAAAAALIQRMALTLVPTTAGAASYVILRRRRLLGAPRAAAERVVERRTAVLRPRPA
jgi:uncharacterized membrane protein YbhN (UPF0104 family)